MAWNPPKSNGRSTRRTEAAVRSRGIWLLLVSVAATVVTGLYFVIGPGADDDGRNAASAPRKCKAVEKAAPPVSAPSASPARADGKVAAPDARPVRVGEEVNGYVMLPSGRIHKPTGAVTNRVANYGKSRYSIFEHRSDNEIAGILMARPGDAVVGAKRYDRWFAELFLKSLETPIVVSPDDEPWQADLKRGVAQARRELKEAHDRGEDIAAIMSESRWQLQDLAKYKRSIKQLYSQNMGECESDEEVGELQRAVNIMLEERGCAPINFTPLTRLNLRKGKSHE